MLKGLGRIFFALKYRTLKRIFACKDSSAPLVVFHKGKEVKIRRRCPHQGGPLEKGYIQGDHLVCPWHGCRFLLAAPSSITPFAPALGTKNQFSLNQPLPEVLSQT